MFLMLLQRPLAGSTLGTPIARRSVDVADRAVEIIDGRLVA